MNVQFDESKFMAFANKKTLAGLELVGAVVDGEIGKNIKQNFHGQGQLAGSITHKVFESEKFVRCSVNKVYAAIQELGGIIKPTKAKALAIPVHPEAVRWTEKGGEPKDFPGLVMIKRKNGAPLLVRIKDKGKKQRFDIMFVLLKSVQIPARPYIRPAVYENKEKIMKIFARANAHET